MIQGRGDHRERFGSRRNARGPLRDRRCAIASTALGWTVSATELVPDEPEQIRPSLVRRRPIQAKFR